MSNGKVAARRRTSLGFRERADELIGMAEQRLLQSGHPVENSCHPGTPEVSVGLPESVSPPADRVEVSIAKPFGIMPRMAGAQVVGAESLRHGGAHR